jgi:hypothetical protein
MADDEATKLQSLADQSRKLLVGEQGVPVDLVGRVLAKHEALGLVPRHLAEVQLPHLRQRLLRRRRRRRRRRRGGGHLVVRPGPRGLVGGAVALGPRLRLRDGRVDGRGPALGPAALGRRRRGGDGGADGLQLGVHGRVQRRPGGRVVGEVEPRRVPSEAVRRLVVGQRGLLGGVEGAQPQPGAVAGEPDLGDPLAPVALPHAAVQLLRALRRRHGDRGLHGLRPRPEARVPLQVELGLDELHLGRAEVGRRRMGRVAEPVGPGGERRRRREGGGRRHDQRGWSILLHDGLHRSHQILAGSRKIYSSGHRRRIYLGWIFFGFFFGGKKKE